MLSFVDDEKFIGRQFACRILFVGTLFRRVRDIAEQKWCRGDRECKMVDKIVIQENKSNRLFPPRMLVDLVTEESSNLSVFEEPNLFCSFGEQVPLEKYCKEYLLGDQRMVLWKDKIYFADADADEDADAYTRKSNLCQ